MIQTWFTSDTHFGHKNILDYEKDARPFDSVEEMNEKIIDNWNKMVNLNDIRVIIAGTQINGKNFYDIKDNESIEEYFDIDTLVTMISSVSYYYRNPDDCPFGHGNWILDIKDKDGSTYYLKYPQELNQEIFVEFLNPLLSRLSK